MVGTDTIFDYNMGNMPQNYVLDFSEQNSEHAKPIKNDLKASFSDKR